MSEHLNGLYTVDLETLDRISTDGFCVLPLRKLVRVEFGAYEGETPVFTDEDYPIDSASFSQIYEDNLGLYFYPLDKIKVAHEDGDTISQKNASGTYAIVEAKFPGDDIQFPSVPTRDQLFVYENRVPDIQIAGFRVCKKLGSGSMVTKLYYPVSEAVRKYRQSSGQINLIK